MFQGAVVCYSGGCDSLTLLAFARARLVRPGLPIHALSFDYGQRHKKEIEYAKAVCKEWGIIHDVYPIDALKNFGRSPLTDSSIDVPNQEELKQATTVVPYRNTLFLVIAAAHATVNNLDAVFIGACREDLPAYPDCRPEYFASIEKALRLADVHHHLCIEAPFNTLYKHEIITLGVTDLKLDFSKAWTCYKGGEKHCGVCDACVERKASFEQAALGDPTEYEDADSHSS